VRDWKGLDNAIRRNRVLLTWAGIALNTSTGSVVTDNIIHDTVEGLAIKHASYATVLDYWGLETAHWSRLLDNTVERSSEASIWIAQSGEPLDYVEVRDNQFAGAGGAFLRDVPSLRGPHVAVDQNAYSDLGGDPRWLYKAGWSSSEGLTDWESVRRETGWETTQPAADAGAAPIAAAPASWTAFGMTPVASSSKGTYYTRNHLDATADGDQSTYWMTEGNRNEYVVFDFGQMRTFNHLILTLYSHEDRRNPRGYRFSVSDDRASWRSILSGVNQDTSGAARYYELAAPVTARYLRFTMVDTFCATYLPRLGCGKNFVLSDLTAGMLAAPAPAEPQTGQQAEIGVGSNAVLTDDDRLRIRVRCVGSTGGRVRFIVRRAGRRRVALESGCRRSVEIPLRRRFVRRLRRGEVRMIRLTAIAPDGDTVTTRVRVRT
jgi:F5/8 type C domain/Right handed beta helix region